MGVEGLIVYQSQDRGTNSCTNRTISSYKLYKLVQTVVQTGPNPCRNCTNTQYCIRVTEFRLPVYSSVCTVCRRKCTVCTIVCTSLYSLYDDLLSRTCSPSVGILVPAVTSLSRSERVAPASNGVCVCVCLCVRLCVGCVLKTKVMEFCNVLPTL